MARIDMKKTTFVIKDGSSNQMEIKIGEGDMKWTPKRNVRYYKNRGKLDSVTLGPDVPLPVNCEFTYELLTIASADTPNVSIRDFLYRINNASAFVTAGADPCEPYAVTLVVTQDQDCSPTPTEVVTFPEFRSDKMSFSIKNGRVSFTGKCKVKRPTVTRV